jgi:hypothetical protein
VLAWLFGLLAFPAVASVNPNQPALAEGFVAWTADPNAASVAATQANTHLGAVYLAAGTVVTGVAVPVGTAANGCTFAGVGVYDANLNLLASSADQHALFGNAVTGWVPVPLSAPFVVPTSGLYYLASGFLASVTLPAVLNITQNATCSTAFPGTTKPRGIHAAVPGPPLPNPATSQGTFTNFPCLAAY